MNNVINPGTDFFKTSKPSAAFINEPIESLSEGIGSSYGVIGYKGKNWSLRYRGEVHMFTRPDDGTAISYIDVVVLRQGKNKAKSYYPDGFDDDASAGRRPLCASIDGIKPDNDVQHKQSDVCALCERNNWKTMPNGKKGRDCTDYKRLAVLLLPSQTQRMLGNALIEPVFLRIPPASLQDLSVFGDSMAGCGWPFHAFVTRISFTTAEAYPKFQFKALNAIGEQEAEMIKALRNDPQSLRITGESPYAGGAVQQLTPPAPAPMPAPAQSIGLVTVPVTPKSSMTTMLPPAREAPNDLSQFYKPQVIDLKPEPQAAPVSAAIGQTAADIGEVVEDASMDARINELLAR